MGKGKISGSARKEINQRRAAEAAKGNSNELAFGRITKLLGHNHVMAAIQSKTGTKEIRVRIPNIFTKKGATPITTRDIVAIYVGAEFDPADVKSTDQFDITAIMNLKQANDLVHTGVIPHWMVHDDETSGNKSASTDTAGWEFGYSDTKEDGENSEDGEENTVPKSKKKNAIIFDNSLIDKDDSNEIDVDAI